MLTLPSSLNPAHPMHLSVGLYPSDLQFLGVAATQCSICLTKVKYSYKIIIFKQNLFKYINLSTFQCCQRHAHWRVVLVPYCQVESFLKKTTPITFIAIVDIMPLCINKRNVLSKSKLTWISRRHCKNITPFILCLENCFIFLITAL